MRKLNEFLNNELNENLEKAKAFIEKALGKHIQGFEVYIDDSSKKPTLVISVDELVDGGADYPQIQKVLDDAKKKFKLSTDKMSNDNVVFLTESSIEDFKKLHEEAYSKAQRRLFAIALQLKKGELKKSDLTPEYADEITKLSELPEQTLRDYAETKEDDLPAKVEESGESFPCCEEPFAYPNFMHGFKGTNLMAKNVLMQFWSKLPLTDEQRELAFDNIMKVQHHLYTQFFLGNPGHCWLRESKNTERKMKNLSEYLKESNKLNESAPVTEDEFAALKKSLPALSKLIKKELKFSPKLDAKLESNGNVRIFSDDIVSELGTTLVKTLFSRMNIYFWGGQKTQDGTIWFNPKLSYEHPGGGSNGVDFVWDSLWYSPEKNEWIEGRKIIK